MHLRDLKGCTKKFLFPFRAINQFDKVQFETNFDTYWHFLLFKVIVQSIAAHRDHFVLRLSVRLSVFLVVTLSW